MVRVHLLCNAQRPAEESPYFFPRMRLNEPIYGLTLSKSKHRSIKVRHIQS